MEAEGLDYELASLPRVVNPQKQIEEGNPISVGACATDLRHRMWHLGLSSLGHAQGERCTTCHQICATGYGNERQ